MVGKKQHNPSVSGAEFLGWLDRFDLTNSDAARLFQVTQVTVLRWQEVGIPGGPASVLVRWLIANNTPPGNLADLTGAPLRYCSRKLFAGAAIAARRHAAERKPLKAEISTVAPSKAKWETRPEIAKG